MNTRVEMTLPLGLEAKYWWWVNNNEFAQMAWLGPFGTAKTDALVTSIYTTAMDYPGATLVLCRDELMNLKRTVLPDLLAKAPELIVHHDRQESRITFPEVTGHDGKKRQSVLYMFGLMTGDYKQKLKSLQPFRIYIDEADKIYEEMFDTCVLRLRQKCYHRVTGEMGVNQVRCVANDEGNNWLWRRFIGKAHPGQEMSMEWVRDNVGLRETYYTPEEADEIYADDIIQLGPERSRFQVERDVDPLDGLIHLVGVDNPLHWLKFKSWDGAVVMQSYCMYAFTKENKSLNKQNLKNARLVSQKLRDQYIKGRIDLETGLLFPEFDANTHVVPYIQPPDNWPVVVGIDHGLEHPSAGAFFAMAPNGDMYIFDEYEEAGASVGDNAMAIKNKVGSRKARFFADTQLWSRDPRNPSETLATDYLRAGIRPLMQANKDRKISINRLKEMLKPRIRFSDPEPRPTLYVMDNCKRTIEVLNQITWEDYKAKINDDLCDALRYGSMGAYDPNIDSSASMKPFKGKTFQMRRGR